MIKILLSIVIFISTADAVAGVDSDDQTPIYDVNQYQIAPDTDLEREVCVECKKVLKFSKDILDVMNIVKKSEQNISKEVGNFEAVLAVTQDLATKNDWICSPKGQPEIAETNLENTIIPKDFVLTFNDQLPLKAKNIKSLILEKGKERVYIFKTILNGEDVFARVNVDLKGKMSVLWYKKDATKKVLPKAELPNLPNNNESPVRIESSTDDPTHDKSILNYNIILGNNSSQIGLTSNLNQNQEVNSAIVGSSGARGDFYQTSTSVKKSLNNSNLDVASDGSLGNNNIKLFGKYNNNNEQDNTVVKTQHGVAYESDFLQATMSKTTIQSLQGTTVDNDSAITFGGKDCNATIKNNQKNQDWVQSTTKSANANCNAGLAKVSIGYELREDNHGSQEKTISVSADGEFSSLTAKNTVDQNQKNKTSAAYTYTNANLQSIGLKININEAMGSTQTGVVIKNGQDSFTATQDRTNNGVGYSVTAMHDLNDKSSVGMTASTSPNGQFTMMVLGQTSFRDLDPPPTPYYLCNEKHEKLNKKKNTHFAPEDDDKNCIKIKHEQQCDGKPECLQYLKDAERFKKFLILRSNVDNLMYFCRKEFKGNEPSTAEHNCWEVERRGDCDEDDACLDYLKKKN